ncbi:MULTISPECIES: zinc-binding alcohol dehydrogenase family protein [Alphaproteobacteria]|uniref:Zinc-type alcohol dehydrogenase-like protein n=2 Tax=Alphaproteobacteria TaxID=28211 RepID=A0A512HG49_9HYPH|nr:MULTISPECIES: zinc-binding alcohol dehydrogenase family protein [Alphaproteobacteria]GEO84433.1 Zn-dependent oxidoreductase [Ciceribacter naphthalenivorans]GLR22396.1 Zn-dependent oxidoreductase [Ciceribacter naphthalenivorans]GLT05252.1 Zn-dependent oxidoreductase [Sphingomonas psychrolutea]
MRAVGYDKAGPISAENALVDFEIPTPEASGHDLLVEIEAVSVNPVDTKVRTNMAPANGERRVPGFDAAGVVTAVGEAVTLFKPGDEVYYAGSIARPGTNSEFHLVDERIVGAKPKSLSFAEAAALPLTAITAYEALFHRLKVDDKVPGATQAILITGGAGGVGSIAIQLAKQLTDLIVVTTASRPESAEWVKSLGADHVLDHTASLAPQYAALGIGAPAFVFSVTASDRHAEDLAEIIAPQGRFAIIDDPKTGFDVMKFKRKAISIHWEMMFARPVFQTADMIEQHKLLSHVAQLVDSGKIRTTLAETFGAINAENLTRAHAAIESGKTRGKIVLEGF